jgi:hypothetical protein
MKREQMPFSKYVCNCYVFSNLEKMAGRMNVTLFVLIEKDLAFLQKLLLFSFALGEFFH